MKFAHFLLSLFLLTNLVGCGDSCSMLDKLFNDPSCHKLGLSVSKSVAAFGTACSGSPNSKQVQVNCPANTGSTQQCTSVSTGFPVYVILVSNNANGSFIDSTGTTYSNCRALIQDFWNGIVQNVQGFYYSDNSSAADTLTCSDTSGCSISTSDNCIAGWKNGTLNGTASFTTNQHLLACVYIDDSDSATQPPPAPAAVGSWDGSLLQVTVPGGTSFNFSTGWVDAY